MRDFSISKNFDFTSISNPNLDRHQDYDKNYGLRVLYLDGYLKNNVWKNEPENTGFLFSHLVYN